MDTTGKLCDSGGTSTSDATAANQVLQITQETAINTILGLMADAACATDNGTCTITALSKRGNQRLTSLITALGTPMQQTGGSVTANAGTNLNTSALALETGGNLATTATNTGTINTNLGAPGATACATDTASCSLNQLMQRLAQRLSTINTTLGTPFQAGGVIGALPAGSAIIGKVGIDQTTPGTTNAVTVTPSSVAGVATTSASGTAAASNLVLKGSAGNLYNVTFTIGATSGYAMLFDATALPANGAVTPVWCFPVTSNGTLGGIAVEFSTPKRFGTGITAVFSTTGCFSLTASATASIFGGYQ